MFFNSVFKIKTGVCLCFEKNFKTLERHLGDVCFFNLMLNRTFFELNAEVLNSIKY